MKPILVLCANPAIELTYFIHGYQPGFISCDTAEWEPGGKGTNVARILHALGAPVHLVLASGGHLGRYVSQCLDNDGIANTSIECLEEIRASVVIVPSDSNAATIIRYPGFPCARQPDSLLEALKPLLPEASALCIAGSLPVGMPMDTYAEICVASHRSKCPVFLDCYGPLLRRTLDAGPFFVKTNRQELEDFTARSLESDQELRAGLETIIAAGAENAIVTLDSQGALGKLMGVWYRLRVVEPPATVNPVGAGDAFMAGLLWSRGRSPDVQLKFAGTIALASTRMRSSGRLPPNTTSFHRFIDVERCLDEP